MKLRIFQVLLSLSLALSPLSAWSSPSSSSKSTYKIGVIAPLTGPNASLGNYIKNGIDLAHQQLKPELRSQMELVYEDDQWQGPRAVAAFQKLSNVQKVNAVIVVGSAMGNAIAPLAEEQNVPMVAIGASDKKVAAGRKFAFIHWVTPEEEARVMVRELKRRNYKKLGIIGTEQEGVIAVMNSLDREMKAQGVADRMVLNKTFLPGVNDFRSYITKARSLDVDGIIVCLFPGSLSSFAKQVRQQGLEVDLMGIELFEDENEVKASAGALIDQWYVNADVATDSFDIAYQQKYGQHPGWLRPTDSIPLTSSYKG